MKDQILDSLNKKAIDMRKRIAALLGETIGTKVESSQTSLVFII